MVCQGAEATPTHMMWCLLAQGLQKSKGGLHTCFECRARSGRGTLQNVLEHDLLPQCRQQHGIQPPHLRLEHLKDRFPALDRALMDFWRHKPRFEWYHPGGGGDFPTGELMGQDSTGRAWFKSVWDGGDHCLRQWSRIDFYRPVADWTNADWAEVASGCSQVSSTMLRDFRAGQKASWMECMVGAVYHVGTNADHLQGSILCVRGLAGPHAMLHQLLEVWRCMVALEIPMPPGANAHPPQFRALPASIELLALTA